MIDIFKSRTVWTFVLLFVIGGVQGTADVMPTPLFQLLTVVLTGLGIYFRVKPVQKFK